MKSLSCVSGIAYVTFSKASEAALAIEKMNGQMLKNTSKSVKVGEEIHTWCTVIISENSSDVRIVCFFHFASNRIVELLFEISSRIE